MDIIYKKLHEIRKNPQMYLGRKSIIILWTYISGYETREWEINLGYSSPFYKFNDFVARYYNTEINFSWARLITAHTNNEESSFDKFYELLDEFLEKNDDK